MNIPYASLFVAAGKKYGVDPALLAAVAKAESQFDPNAVSPAGALGLMQIMPSTAANLGVNPLDPPQAVDGAARLLQQNLKKFGSTSLALAAYNAGPGAVVQYGGIPPYPETQNYVRKVLEYQKEFTGFLGSTSITAWVKDHPYATAGLGLLAVGGLIYFLRPDVFRQVPIVGRFAARENPAPRRRGHSRVQTLIFPRARFTPAEAKAWAHAHQFKSGSVDVTEHSIRLRQEDPSRFSRMRTIRMGSSPVQAVVGFPR